MSYACDCPVDCKYRSNPASMNTRSVTCDFILIEGHSRGCDPKPYCERYRKRGSKKEKKPGQMTPVLGSPRNIAPWDYEKGYRLYQLGMTTSRIADELKISFDAVRYRRRKYWNKGTP